MCKSTILEHLGDHLPQIEKAVQNGYESIVRCYGEHADVHSKNANATLRHDHMIRAAQELLPTSDFHFSRATKRDLFTFHDLLMLEFRKLSPHITVAFNRTLQCKLFTETGEVDLFGNSGPLPLISVGYVASQGIGIAGIFMTQIVSKQPAWVHRLDKGDTPPPQTTSIITPNDPIPNQPSRIRRPATGGHAAGSAQG